MKYMNSLVFLSLMLLVAGCQKKEQPAPVKKAHHTSAHDAKMMNAKEKPAPKKTGPTMLETKKSVDNKAMAHKEKAASMKKAMPADKKAAPAKMAEKKAMPKKSASVKEPKKNMAN